MTSDEAQTRLETLKRRRDELFDQLTSPDAQSASVSSGAGSKSYTNRSVADIKAKLRALDREIARLEAFLDGTQNPSTVRTIYARFNG